MIMPKIALKLGMGMATRPATASAHITASTTSSRAWGLRPSKARKKGISSSTITSVLVT